MDDIRRAAILLLGPTGSGKTPLGQLLEERGLWGHPCRHFDFGAGLRDLVARDQPDASVGTDDLALLHDMLRTGALLEDEHFPLATRILRRFVATYAADPQTWLVLNGLPRHVGQAQAMADLVDVRVVVCLDCSPETVLRRIHTNVGGDRTRRSDDDVEAIRQKLAVFAERTLPLAEFYRHRGARMETIAVTAEMTPEEAWRVLEISAPPR